MEHAIEYDLARGLHIIAVIAWMSGLLMLPRFYANIAATAHGEASEAVQLANARRIRWIIMTPGLVLSWALGLFLFGAYFISDYQAPPSELASGAPPWFLLKLALVIGLSAYHGVLVVEGRKLARGERRRSARFWDGLSILAFLVAVAVVLLATLEP